MPRPLIAQGDAARHPRLGGNCYTTVELSTIPLEISAEGLLTEDCSVTPRDPRVRRALCTSRGDVGRYASRKCPCASESTPRHRQSQLCCQTLGRRTVHLPPLSGSEVQTLGRQWLTDRGTVEQGYPAAKSPILREKAGYLGIHSGSLICTPINRGNTTHYIF